MVQPSALARHRRSLGHSQQRVAEALGMTQAAVSQWESGARTPNDRQLVALARLYRLDPGQLLDGGDGDDPVNGDLAEMLFRSEADHFPSARPGLRRFLAFLKSYADLAEAAEYDVRGLAQSPYPTAREYQSAADARRKAEQVRAHLGLGLGPIGHVDLLLEMLGITVYRASLGPDLSQTLSGAFYNHSAIGFSVLANLDMTPGRRRFTLAHELAHALFHSDVTYVVSGPARTSAERFADLFAGEFLFPSEGVRRLMEEQGMPSRLTDPADAIYLQRYYGVSWATCVVRLKMMRAVADERIDAFTRGKPVLLAGSLGYEIGEEERNQDPQRWRMRRYPGRFLRLLRHAMEAGIISPPSAAEMTDLTIDEISEMLVNPPQDDGDPAVLQELEEFRVTGVVGV